jgi:hypothetical protein
MQVLAPGASEEAGEVLQKALLLHDIQLATFLARFAARVRDSARPVTVSELRAMLEEVSEAGAARHPV